MASTSGQTNNSTTTTPHTQALREQERDPFSADLDTLERKNRIADMLCFTFRIERHTALWMLQLRQEPDLYIDETAAVFLGRPRF
jgi:hypothetical protein